ncbi:amidase family protein [Alicyclobacillus shizuokensis]|uniref:amidase family protein n=1 Tax=Alicyclobacillus shizuokensis TaxID=392014 RepID=UPI000830F60A|nr:amidase family protein [Alicyclobacillus shizuokensis]
MTELEWMERFAYSYANAYRYRDSVVWVNRTAPTTARHKLEAGAEPILFGVKDTNQIPRDLVERLAAEPDFVWLTVDKMAAYGRALDPDLVNPLTGQWMTGSSSGSAVNILRGVHDLAIATDGGGSILGPALAAQLYGINGKGLGLVGAHPSRSTEGMPLSVGIGVLSHSLAFAKRAMEALFGQALDAPVEGLRVALDEAAPDHLADALSASGCTVRRFAKGESHQRVHGLALMAELFQDCQVIVSAEGPVDVDEYADSLVMNGQPTARGGKHLLRSANLADTTAVAVAGSSTASGFVVMAPNGVTAGAQALAVARVVAEQCPRPTLFEDYFLGRMRSRSTGFFHEGM